MRRGHWTILCAGVIGAGLLGPAAQADLLAHEPFPLPSTQMAGMNTGTGFAGPWTPGGFNASVSTNYAVHSQGLSFGPLTTSGGRGLGFTTGAIAGLTRPLSEPMGAPGTTRYLSFLLRPEGTLGQGVFNGFFGLVLESAGEPEIFVGKPGGGTLGQYVIESRGGAGQFSSLTPVVVGQTSLLVVKAEFDPVQSADRFTLFVNPLPGAAEPLVGTVKQDANVGTLSGLTLYSTGAFSIDEIRVGETFADVTPVPEPALGGAILLAAGLLARRRPCQQA